MTRNPLRLPTLATARPVPDPVPDPRRMVQSAAGILLDWDGCVAHDDVPHAAGLTFLRRYADKIAIVSNSSTLWPSDIQEVLAALGIIIPAGRIVLAGHHALVLAARLGLTATVIGTPHMKALARQLGVRQVTIDPEIIVLLRDTRFTYSRLKFGVNALVNGARLIVANPDLTHPGPKGAMVPETGALLAAFGACVPLDRISVDVLGKPYPHMFHTACEALDLRPSQVLMIGDNPLTDVEGARQLGIPALLVSPGSALGLDELC